MIRWLWMLGARMVMPKVWQAATQRATEAATSAIETMAHPTPCSVLALCQTQTLVDALADLLSHTHRTDGNGFTLQIGSLAKRRLVVALPDEARVDQSAILRSIVEAHRPTMLLAVCHGTQHGKNVAPGDLVVARSIAIADGPTVEPGGTVPALAGIHYAAVASTETSASEAIEATIDDDWAAHAVQLATECKLPLVLVAAVLEPPADQRSAEIDALGRQSSLVAKAGVLAGMAWKKPSGYRALWNHQEAKWKACSHLATFARHLVEALPADNDNENENE